MMTRIVMTVCFAALLVSASPAASAQPSVAQWWKPYADTEAKGKHVLGFWQFDGEEEAAWTRDSSTHGHKATVRGAKFNAHGRFGGCLESDAGYPVADTSHSIHAATAAALSPRGPFTIELWIKPKDSEETPPQKNGRVVLLDRKYVTYDHRGFMLTLNRLGGDVRTLTVEIGLGSRSETWQSRPFPLTSRKWRHVAYTYDAGGTVMFFVDGSEMGRVSKPDAGPMAPSDRPLAIGDRIGSLYNGFPGFIDEVRMTAGARDFRPFRFEPTFSRFVFVRRARLSKITGELINQTDEQLEGLAVVAHLPGGVTREMKLPPLAVGAEHYLEFVLDPSLKAGEYQVPLTFTVSKWSGKEDYQSTTLASVVIKPRPLPHRMPVVMWGVGGTDHVVKEIPRLKDIGFTHCLGLRADYQKIWDEGATALPTPKEQIRDGQEMLNTALENDIGVVATLAPGSWLRRAEAGKPFLRIDRNGKHYGREDIAASFPPIQEFCFNTGAAMGRAYGEHPAFDAVLLHTEIRGESQVSFHPEEIAAYRAATGEDIPPEVTIKNGVQYQKLKDFPEDRVIADDHPILRYLQWFWKKGDGWNDLNTQLHRGLKKQVKREDFWTFYDPAVRVPSISGSGGEADVLSHWTYSYPDPIRIGLCTDELFEMARVNGHGQDVMKMTQVIWYRSQTAPENATSAGQMSPWVDQDPDAAYITIAPMHLREAFWWKIARPIKGIMYHGWQSLVETETTSAYRYTNPNTRNELKRLVHDVVTPLGPTLVQVPDAPSDVAFLESFTSQMFARRGTYGWNHSWAGDMYHILMYAQLQPRVLYEESLLQGGLADVKLLVLADCDVLTESCVKAIREFQKGGGLVITDTEVCPAIKADLVVPRFSRTKQARVDREKLLDHARKLRSWLDSRYKRAVDSTSLDVVTRRRQFGTTDYVFAVNDRRDFGSYVGGYGLVMEDGLPAQTTIQIRRDAGYVYDLVERRERAVVSEASYLNLPLQLGPCEGRVFMVTQRPIRDVTVEAPAEARRGEQVSVQVTVTDGETPIDAVVPLLIRIVDPEGVESEFTGHYGAAKGAVTLQIDFAPNDRLGVWEIHAQELASGRTGNGFIRLNAK